MGPLDIQIVGFLALASIGCHLWKIWYPCEVVFDEYHFGTFINCYIKRMFFYDIHPPFGKLLLYALARISRYDGSIDFQSGHTPGEFYVFLRIEAAIFASFAQPLLYLALRACRLSALSSFSVAFIFICETSILSESRFILTDGMMLTLISLHFFCLSAINSPVLIGITLGLCISVKQTSLSLVPFTFMALLMNGRSLRISLMPSIIAAIIYIFFSAMHIYMLSDFANSDVSGLSKSLVDYLKTRSDFISTIPLAFRLGFEVHNLNMKILQFHPYQSRPLTWPLLTGIFVGLWNNDDGSEIDCIGNPFVYYPSFICVLILSFRFVSFRRSPAALSFLGYWLSFLPFFLVPRSLFLYHYHIPLFFSMASIGVLLDGLRDRRHRISASLILTLSSLFGFLYWFPFVYGERIANKAARFWNPVWQRGDFRHRAIVSEFFPGFKFD